MIMKKTKRIFCALFVFLLLITLTPWGALAAPGDATPPFTDITDHWGAAAIAFMFARDLMRGTSPTIFEPDAIFTRAQTATLLYRIAGEPAVTGAAPFSDVASGMWYSDAIAWVHQRNIVQGVGGGRFAPDAPITREEMATLLYRFAAYKGWDMTVPPGFVLDFLDADQTSPWAEPAMRWAVYNGLIRHVDAAWIRPLNTLTRADAAVILMRTVVTFTPPTELLCPELETIIKQDWVDAHTHISSVDDVIIDVYLGTYNGRVPLMIRCIESAFATIVWEEEVAGFVFFYWSGQRILLWDDGAFYTLPNAYELGLLTAEDIGRAHLRYNQFLWIR